MKGAILQLIGTQALPPGNLFKHLALRLFKYQFEQNRPYRELILSQNINADTIQDWDEIPPFPAMAFKFSVVACRPLSLAERVFVSSGTTQEERSRHAFFDLDIAKAAILTHFKKHLLPDRERIRFAILTPSPQEAPQSSLSHMMEVVRTTYGSDGSGYYIEGGRLQSEQLAADLLEASTPICLLGTSFSFVHFIDFFEQKGRPCPLPKGSRLMDTGGLKGKSRTVPPEWIYQKAESLWEIPRNYCVNEYGMTEMTSQFYDGIIGTDIKFPRAYMAPPQVKTRVLSPETLEPVAKGEIGILAHYDLANIDSVAAILTEDLGREVTGGFLLIGRAAHAPDKGCSIAIEELLERDNIFSTR